MRATMGEHGRGTRVAIETTRKDGTIRRRIRVAVTMADGRRVWRTVKTEREADRIQDKLVEARELDLDPSRQTRLTLAAYLRSWIGAQRDAKRRRIRDRTLIGYERLIEQRIIPGLGTVPLGRLSKRRIQTWVDGQDGSAQTIRNAHAVLRRALAGIVGEVIAANPAVGVELPDRSDFAGAPLSSDEASQLLEVAEAAPDRLATLWRLAIVTGLREGELLGLPRDALTGSTLTVAGQLQRLPGKREPGRKRTPGRWVLGPTKAGRALATIELDEGTAAAIRAHLARMVEERTPDWRYFGLMFPTPSGEPYHAADILREFHAICDAAGITRRRIHDLRHTSATILTDIGVPEETRMARMGHSTKRMARHYGAASKTQDRSAVDRLAEAIDR